MIDLRESASPITKGQRSVPRGTIHGDQRFRCHWLRPVLERHANHQNVTFLIRGQATVSHAPGQAERERWPRAGDEKRVSTCADLNSILHIDP